nr:MAG TPA: hypothetical protein [Bacteriophage sp.]
MTWIVYYSPHIFSLRSKDLSIRFNDSYPSIFHCKNQKRQFAISYKTLWIVLIIIKILINAEKHEKPISPKTSN